MGLSVINKRSDGYHNLETVFYPLAVRDVLEIIPSENNAATTERSINNRVEFFTSGLQIEGNSADNLCVRAYYLLLREFPTLPPIQMHLHKVIPMGAGLGGGSSDGAFVLRLLNSQFNLGLSSADLIAYALQLGSDCPFFIINSACLASGRGEIMEPVSLDLSAFDIVLVNAGISINTGWAFSQLNFNRPISNLQDLKNIITAPLSEWKNLLHNDFEEPVFEKFPEIKAIKDKLYQRGALYASMTGSGSTLFGIFEKEAAPSFDFPTSYWLTRIPG